MTMFRNNFLSKHHSYYNDTSLLLLQQKTSDHTHCHGSLYLLSGDKFEKTLKSVWVPTSEQHGSLMRVLGSGIHGILCLEDLVTHKYVFWNPTTQEFRITPPSPPYGDACITPHGFGYDHVTDDFKVIRHIAFYPEPLILDRLPRPLPRPFWEIYSLRSNSWRKLDADMPSIRSDPGMGLDIYTNGVCHWIGCSLSYDYGLDTHLVSFNFSNEIFYTTPLPLGLADTRVKKYLSPLANDLADTRVNKYLVLAVLNESIALILKNEETTTLHIWILGELGLKESWTKLFTIGLRPLHGLGFPIGVGKMGNIFFRKENGELALFDLSTQMLKEIAATKLVKYFDQMIIYKESILPIGRTGH